MGLLLTFIEGLMADALQLWLLAMANVLFYPGAFAGMRPQAAFWINYVSNKTEPGIQVEPLNLKLIMSEEITSLKTNTIVGQQTDQEHARQL